MTPSYIDLHARGELRRRARAARERLTACRICPRACKVDRTIEVKRGVCGLSARAEVASAHPHFGEESPLVGRRGSGTIFFTSCNLRCVFCQNYDISQMLRGREVSAAELAGVMLELQGLGCHNINLVTPSPHVPAILEALVDATEAGLRIPIVYNTSAYDAVETLELLDGVVDVYMPDLKTLDPDSAKTYLRARDYPEVARAALKEMHRQVGDLQIDPDTGVATRGLLVRHLVMPEGLATTRWVLTFLRDELSANTYVNIMAQYHPAGEASRFPRIDRPILTREYQEALEIAREVGMSRLDRRRPKFLFFF